jgi:CxxC motif-containing protein (DUF1111 family)
MVLASVTAPYGAHAARPGLGVPGGGSKPPGGGPSIPGPADARGPRGPGQAVFEDKLDGLPADLLQAFSRGDEAFERTFPVAEGLGPVFNNEGCESCHLGNGKGPNATNFILYGRLHGDTFDHLSELGGPQLFDKGIPGAPPQTIPNEANVFSTRNPPPVFGMGFIEAIPASEILARADPDDANRDGISGRPNYVTQAFVGAAPGLFLGRFGRKASTVTLLEQTARAYRKDIGITTPFFPVESYQQGGPSVDRVPDPEIGVTPVLDSAMYVRLLKPPPPGPRTPQVQAGERLFEAIGCASCHVPVLRTGHNRIAALSNKEVRLYSDLLLHDMGPVLADGFPDGMATGSEWRTTPLWGVALAGPPFLHDGRANTLEEAVLAHGGEAQGARDRFAALPPNDLKALIAFLDSL